MLCRFFLSNSTQGPSQEAFVIILCMLILYVQCVFWFGRLLWVIATVYFALGCCYG